MNLDSIPYMIVSRDLPTPLGPQRVFVCLCLIDHLILGIGTSRDEALDAMTAELHERDARRDHDDPCLN
jgi:hypothetical protein